MDKLNEFADSTLEFGSSLLKRLKTEAFGLASNQEQREMNSENSAQRKENVE